MPAFSRFDAGGRPAHRTALGRLFAIWAALPRAVRSYARDFAAVAAGEGREVPGRLTAAAIGMIVAAVLAVSAWLLLCAGTAAWLVAAQDWRWETALYAVALANVVLGLSAGLLAYRSLKTPFFPYTSYEIDRLRHGDLARPPEGAPTEALAALRDPGPRERALLRSEAELEARLTEVRYATPQLIATPSVIAAVAGAGLVVGLLTSQGKSRAHREPMHAAHVPLTRQLLNIAFGQLSSLAVAAAMREFQRRAGHHGPPY